MFPCVQIVIYIYIINVTTAVQSDERGCVCVCELCTLPQSSYTFFSFVTWKLCPIELCCAVLYYIVWYCVVVMMSYLCMIIGIFLKGQFVSLQI